ncbi:Prefoldin subunit 2 [Blattella germanica]|nr:Prefoldin subunit 2 [Blattella germanica]
MATEGKKFKTKGKTNEEIFNGFQALRGEQRHMANKLSEMELELHEHKIVIDTLEKVDGDRKCFKMIGGVLCERTVKEVLPMLISNRDQLGKFIESLNEQLIKKGQEVNEYKEKFNIKIRGQDEHSAGSTDGDKKPRTGNVLVVNPM